MPTFHLQWHVRATDGDAFTAFRDVKWDFVPAPGIYLELFKGSSPVQVEEVHLLVSGNEGHLVLQTFDTKRQEQFNFLREQLPGHGWRLE